MKRSFSTKQTQFYKENDVWVLSFAGSVESISENYVILSRTCFPEEDKELGPYIESSFSVNGYDVLSSITIEEHKIILHLRDKKIHCLEILFDDSEQINNLKQVITKIVSTNLESNP